MCAEGFGASICVGARAGFPPEPLTYRWFKDGQALEHETGAALQLTEVTEADAGLYHVVVRCESQSATKRSRGTRLVVSGIGLAAKIQVRGSSPTAQTLPMHLQPVAVDCTHC